VKRGVFFSFEGIDGTGKSTQVALLEAWFTHQHLSCLCTREPGGTPFGEKLRTVLLEAHEPAALAESFLFQAARAEHVEKVILPALANGTHVITDRFYDSSVVYQGQKIGTGLAEALSLLASDGLRPDLTFLLDLDPAKRYTTSGDRFETRELEVHQKTRALYLEYAKEHPKRLLVLDATRSREDLHDIIIVIAYSYLKEKGYVL